MEREQIKNIIELFIDWIDMKDGFEEEAIDDAVDYIQAQYE